MYGHLNNSFISDFEPSEFYLSQNYPHPFKDKTVIKYCLASRTTVLLTIHDAEGKEIEKLVDEEAELAAEHREISAVLAFSPGEYLGPGEPVRGWAAKVTVPVFVTSATGAEVEAAARIVEAVQGPEKYQTAPVVGVHGSSTLREDRNPHGAEQNWTSVEAFLKRIWPAPAMR